MKEIVETWRKLMVEHADDVNAAAGILLFNKNGEVLLSKRSENVNNPGTIGTIGGHLTKGEPPSIGAKREFYEEASYKGPFEKFKILYVQEKDDGFKYYTFLAYTDKEDAEEFQPLEAFSHEIEWNKWLNFEEIKDEENLHPGLKELFEIDHIVLQIRKFINDIK